MNKIIRYNKKYIFSLMLSAIAIAISSCGSNQSANNPENIEPPVASSPLPTPTSETQPPEIDIT
ncbi:MAG: sporulation/spore germination protein, partial [Rivularia sp. (in: cyanobacteria)]